MMGKEEAGKQRRDRKENGRGRKWWSMVDLMIFPVFYSVISQMMVLVNSL